jgi:Leucine-rich repeat (LRR) protein
VQDLTQTHEDEMVTKKKTGGKDPRKKTPKKVPHKKTVTVFKNWKEALQAPEQVEELVLDVRQLPRVVWPKAKPLPADIGKLVNLRVLEIRARNLEGLCPELSTLQKLETLSIQNSDFVLDLDPVLATLPSLRSLELYNVGLTGFVPLPQSIELLSLEANDRLEVAAWCAGLQKLPRLRSLSLAQSCPGPLPAKIATLPALRSLTLAQNGYQELPAGVFQLTELEELDLSLNPLTALPAEIASLRAMKVLKLWDTAITQLPRELRHLSALEVLLLGSLQLRELPSWIGELTSLRWLDLRATPLNDLPPCIADLPLQRLWVDVPPRVLAELERRLPACEIRSSTVADMQRLVEGGRNSSEDELRRIGALVGTAPAQRRASRALEPHRR